MWREPLTVKVIINLQWSICLSLLIHLYQALSERISLNAQAYTLYSSVRPFGVSTIFGGVDKTGPSLYIVEPSGVCLVSTL